MVRPLLRSFQAFLSKSEKDFLETPSGLRLLEIGTYESKFPMRHVFVSYSRRDSETVNSIVARLTKDGLNVWLDREAIKGGDVWRESIVEAVDNAYACVLMLSPNSVTSDNVRKEVDLADGASKDLIPIMLAPVELPAKLRYQLAGIQWIEYYRDPEAKYAELAEVLHTRKPQQILYEVQPTREVELRITGVDISKFGPEAQEKLLQLISEVIGTPRTDLKLTALKAGSVHAFVSMLPDAAYRLKTAALNRDARLIRYGIDALRLTGDRHFVFLKEGRIAPLKSGNSGGRWFIGGLILVIALVLSALIFTIGLPLASPFISSFFASVTPTLTNTFTLTPSSTPTATETPTSTPSRTLTPTNTFTLTPTRTSTSTPSRTATPTSTFTPSPTATNIPTLTPNPPSVFLDPIVSSDHVVCNDPVTIREIVMDPNGISGVEIHFWVVNKTTGETRYESSLQMKFVPAGLFSHWERQISSLSIQDWPPTEYWLQFYFIATDNAGIQTLSPRYYDRITYTSCPLPPA